MKKHRDYKKEYRERKKKSLVPPGVTSKRCKDCKKNKDFKHFPKHIIGKYGYDARCRKCYNINRQKNPHVLLYEKEYRNRPEIKKKNKAYMKKWCNIDNDAYIRTLIVPKPDIIKRKEVTQEMLDIKRKELKIKQSLHIGSDKRVFDHPRNDINVYKYLSDKY